MSQSARYRARSHLVVPARSTRRFCRKLTSRSRSVIGGDYADLFFGIARRGGLSFEEGITKSASRGVGMGLGVRVQKGDATGYAHVEDLSWEAMSRAARPPLASRTKSSGAPPQRWTPLVLLPSRYELPELGIDVERRRRSARCSSARSRTAHAFDPPVVKGQRELRRRGARGVDRDERRSGWRTTSSRSCVSVSPW